jgi:prevent-host-death family protein
MAEKIGIRELQRETSRYVARVETGERIEVSRHGRIVAMLVPAMADEWEQMIASGRILAPTEEGYVTDEAPLELDVDLAALLQANRGR